MPFGRRQSVYKM
uniref:Uncharacterized protein n=1 Tax=Anguilla anguilla TaxID=7936 RepID=A0A0E9RZY6_ANGAN